MNRVSRLLGGSREIFAVFSFSATDVKTGMPFPRTPASMETFAIQNGLKVDFDSCVIGKLDVPSAVRIFVSVEGERVERKFVRGYFFCHAHYKPEIKDLFHVNPHYEAVFKQIEEACPRLFYPKGSSTVCEAALCYRKYAPTDTAVGIMNDGQVISIHYGAADHPVLGTMDDLMRDPSKITCDAGWGRYVPWSPGASMLSGGTTPGR
jgi:hypothetical protein